MSGSIYSRYFFYPLTASEHLLLQYIDSKGGYSNEPPICLIHPKDIGFTAPYLRQHLRSLWQREFIISEGKDLVKGAYSVRLTQLGRTFLAGVEQPLFPNF